MNVDGIFDHSYEAEKDCKTKLILENNLLAVFIAGSYPSGCPNRVEWLQTVVARVISTTLKPFYVRINRCLAIEPQLYSL